MPPPKKENPKAEGGPTPKDVDDFIKPDNLEKQKDEVLELFESGPIIDAGGKDPLEGLVPPIDDGEKPSEEKEEKPSEGDGDADGEGEKKEGEAADESGDDGVSGEGKEGEPLSEEEQLALLTKQILGEVDDGEEGDDAKVVTIDGREYTPVQVEQIIRQFGNLQPQYNQAIEDLKKMGQPTPVDGAAQTVPGVVPTTTPAVGTAGLLTPEAEAYIARVKEADPQAGAVFESMMVRQAQLENYVVNQGQANTVATRNQAVLTGFNNGVAQLLQEPEYQLLANPKVATRFGQLALQMTQGQSPEILTNVMFLRGVYGRMVSEATAKGTRQSAKTKAKRAASESKAAGGGLKSAKSKVQEEMDDFAEGAIKK